MADTEETPKEWFKKLWVESFKDDEDFKKESFEEVFSVYKNKWFADFKEYFMEVAQLEQWFQHPRHQLTSE